MQSALQKPWHPSDPFRVKDREFAAVEIKNHKKSKLQSGPSDSLRVLTLGPKMSGTTLRDLLPLSGFN